MESVRRLGDGELLAGLKRLVGSGQVWLVRLLEHMGEVDARRLYRERAFSSMFDFAVAELGMSEDEALFRIRVARAGRAFPLVLELLGRGELHLTGVRLLAPLLTQANHAEVLQRARRKTKREVELLIAELAPKADVPSTIRKLPEPKAQVALAESAQSAESPADTSGERAESLQSEMRLAPVPRNTAPLPPLSPGRFKVQFTAHQRLHDKLKQARDLMRHQVPDGDLAELVERAMDLLIAHQRKVKFASGVKPRAQPQAAPQSRNRHVPNAVKRAVVARDGEQCSFVSTDGRRCSERGRLELHHHGLGYARGGLHETKNLAVMCRAHNGLLAERDYGRAFMERKRVAVVPERTTGRGAGPARNGAEFTAVQSGP